MWCNPRKGNISRHKNFVFIKNVKLGIVFEIIVNETCTIDYQHSSSTISPLEKEYIFNQTGKCLSATIVPFLRLHHEC